MRVKIKKSGEFKDVFPDYTRPFGWYQDSAGGQYRFEDLTPAPARLPSLKTGGSLQADELHSIGMRVRIGSRLIDRSE